MPTLDPTLRPRNWRDLAIPIAITGFIALAFRPHFYVPGIAMDEAMLLVYPDQMRMGKVPYLDFETFYGPANLWILRFSYAAFGDSLIVERCIGLVYRNAIALALFSIGARFSYTLGTLAALLCALIALGVPTAIPIAWLSGTACALWSVVVLTGNKRAWRSIVAGALAGCALLFRQDLGPPVLVASAFLLWRYDRRVVRDFMIGFAFALSPYALLLFTAGFGPLLDNLLIYPVFHQSGRRLPLTGELAGPAVVLLLCTFAALAISFALFRRKTPHACAMLAISILALGMLPQALQRADDGHIFLVGLTTIAWSIVPITAWFAHRQKTSRKSAVAAAVCSVVVLCTVWSKVDVTRRTLLTLKDSMDPSLAQPPSVVSSGRRFTFSSEAQAKAVERICVGILKSGSPGQRLFVGPLDLRRTNYNDTFFYYLLPQFPPATYFLEMNPLSANRPHSRLATDLATAEWVILTAEFDDWDEPNDSMKFGSDEPAQILTRDFELVDTQGPLFLLRKKHHSDTPSPLSS